MMNRYIPLLPDNMYHIYNRAVGNEKLFISDKNYYFFLEKMKQYLLPVMDIFTYSLLPNHFHLMIRVKSEKELLYFYGLKNTTLPKDVNNNLSDFVMKQVGNLLNSYAKSFNRMYSRQGSLFLASTKRSVVKIDSDVTNFILYVHKNAVHHGIARTIGEWPFDGYQEIVSDLPTFLLRDELFEWFGSKNEFVRIHRGLEIERK